MSSNKKRDMEASDDEDEYDEDYKDKGRSHDALLRKIRMLRQRCIENKIIIKRLKMDLRLPKSHVRLTKCQIRINCDWDGEEANFDDLVLSFVKEYLFLLTWLLYHSGYYLQMMQIFTSNYLNLSRFFGDSKRQLINSVITELQLLSRVTVQ
jgi:hypothetical protein